MFGTKKEDLVKSLSTRSQNALNVFKQTQVNLGQLNEEIQEAQEVRLMEKERIERDLKELLDQQLTNTKVIDKIEEFLN